MNMKFHVSNSGSSSWILSFPGSKCGFRSWYWSGRLPLFWSSSKSSVSSGRTKFASWSLWF
jgi:hypothetical protein